MSTSKVEHVHGTPDIILKNNKTYELCGGHSYWCHVKFLVVFVTVYTRFYTQPYQIRRRFHICLELTGYPFSSQIMNTRLMTSFLGQPGWARTRKVKSFRILMKQEMMGWQWHQLKHMQITCCSPQTDNCVSTTSLGFLEAGCSSWHPTNSVKGLKAVW